MREKPSVHKPLQRPTLASRTDSDTLSTTSVVPQATPSENMTISRMMYLQSVAGNKATRQLVNGAKIQRSVNMRLSGQQDTQQYNNLAGLCKAAGIKKAALLIPMKTRLLEGNHFSAEYKANFDAHEFLQLELKNIIYGLDSLIPGANSSAVIVTNTGNAQAVANQLYSILAPKITQEWLKRYPHVKTSITLGNYYTDFLQFNTLFSGKQEEYTKLLSSKDSKRFQHRLDRFTEKAEPLKIRIENALAQDDVPDSLMNEVVTFMTEFHQFELAWDLDFQEGEDKLEDKVDNELASNESLGDKYQIGGGTDDEVNVGDEYRSLLACTFYAILTVKPGWLGAETPQELHSILRKTGKLKAYDDDRVAAKIRYLAGLTPTMIGSQNKTVKAFLKGEASKRGEKKNYIIDAEGIAHTFAAKWDGEKYVKVDEQTPAGGAFGKFENKKALTAWN